MSLKSYVLVVNLHSRQAAAAINEIEAVFKREQCQLKIIKVKNPATIKDSFADAIKLNPDVIVLGGGDGTLISGIEYLSQKNYSGDIGLLPLGTANYLARNLNIPLDIPGSIAKLFTGQGKNIPVGVANNKCFALMFVLGLTQATAENVSDKLKKKFGQAAYAMELIKQAKKHTAFQYTIESPSLGKTLHGTTHQILVYNSDLNQQVKLLPDHQLKKPTLKVVVSRSGHSMIRLFAGFLLHIVSFGKLRPYMYVFEASSLKIATKPPLKADYDGEPHGKSPFEISMYDKRVRIIY